MGEHDPGGKRNSGLAFIGIVILAGRRYHVKRESMWMQTRWSDASSDKVR